MKVAIIVFFFENTGQKGKYVDRIPVLKMPVQKMPHIMMPVIINFSLTKNSKTEGSRYYLYDVTNHNSWNYQEQ